MMIGIGTPSNHRSAPLAIVASVVVSDNGATLSGFLVLLIERRLATHRRGPPETRADLLGNYDVLDREERSKLLHVP